MKVSESEIAFIARMSSQDTDIPTATAGSLSVTGDNSGSTLSTGSSVSVTGDAIINNRKKKLIPSYELEVKGTWKGRATMHSFSCSQKCGIVGKGARSLWQL